MPTYPIQLKRNGTAAATPSSLLHGEVALNYADAKIFWKDASNVIQSFTFQAYALSSHTHAASDITSGTLDAARLPLATTIAAGAVIVGTGLGVSSGTVSVSYGTTSGTACQGNDARLSDTRTPTDGSVTTAKLANDAVTYAKIQNVSATDRLLGRSSAGAGDVEEILCGSFGRSLIGSADAAAARSTLSVQPTASPAFTGAATFTVSSGSSVPVTVANSGTGNSLVVANNFIVDGSGRLGFFAAPRAFEACAVLGTAPSSSQTSIGFRFQAAFPSSTTGDAASFSSFPVTQAASYTLTNLNHFACAQQQFGAGSTVTNQYGLYVDSTLTGATNNYAVYTGIASGTGRWAIYAAGTAASYFGGQVQISAGSGSSGSYKPGVAVSGDDDTGLQQVGGANTISLVTAGSERMRVDASGNVNVGTTDTNPAGNNVAGVRIDQSGLLNISRNQDIAAFFNRKGNDGAIIWFLQEGTVEGDISVAGNTVSYNAFCGSHWAQLIDGSRPAILRGTVLETIDEMCEWPGEPKNDRLPRVKVSDTPRSRRVYGVFMAWDEDYAASGDLYATALGAYMVRVSGVVQSGDLLESAGDGTARTQSDDIVRSSTIGKVSSTHRVAEYDDGSYLLPCVLMCG